MKYDYSKLLWAMQEKHLTQAQLAEILGISEATLNRKLKNKREFKQTEMRAILKAIGAPIEKVSEYFFAH